MPSSNPGWRRYRRWLPWSRPARASALAHERPQFAAIGNRHAADADIDRRRHRHHARQQFDAVARGHVAQHRIAGQRGKRFQFTAVAHEIVRASCRERVWQYGETSVVADSLKKKKKK